jgi:hypothetical protein
LKEPTNVYPAKEARLGTMGSRPREVQTALAAEVHALMIGKCLQLIFHAVGRRNRSLRVH